MVEDHGATDGWEGYIPLQDKLSRSAQKESLLHENGPYIMRGVEEFYLSSYVHFCTGVSWNGSKKSFLGR